MAIQSATEAGPSVRPAPSGADKSTDSGLGGTFTRPPFRPTEISKTSPPPFFSTSTSSYIPTFSHQVHFSREHFFSAIKDLAIHPERNSSLILRADALPPKSYETEPDEEVVSAGLRKVEEVRVKLMPKQVKRDGKLDQRITFYEDNELDEDKEGLQVSGKGKGRGIVMMCPEATMVEDVPFYHPPVKKLAFIYEPILSDAVHEGKQAEDGEGDPFPVKATISLAYLPFDQSRDHTPDQMSDSSVQDTDNDIRSPFLGVRPTKSPRKRSPLSGAPIGEETDRPAKPPATILTENESTYKPAAKVVDQAAIAQRTVRTCRMLLERVYKFGHGNMVGYTKRVLHDVIVNRESFQDLYLILKERHRHLDSRVTKAHRLEDVKRHVWKYEPSLPCDPTLPTTDLSHWGAQDVAIATFLMLLWKELYPEVDPSGSANGTHHAEREWDTWGRPPSGFVDLGCGNGLLVHILIAEGYKGKGYELRARKTWPNYPPATQEALIEYPISFPDWFPPTVEEWQNGDWEGKADCPIKEGCFIIGNHADEITPWMPLLSLIPAEPVPFLSLPCCLHTLDGAFNSLTFDPPQHSHTPEGGFSEGLEEGLSRYKAYLMWLGWCGLKCGWKWEKEGLRIPSTKGWGIIARSRWTKGCEEEAECRRWALEQVEGVRQRGLFKVREKEGKDTH